MKEIEPTKIPGNAIQMIGKEWMLVTANDIRYDDRYDKDLQTRYLGKTVHALIEE